MGDHKLTRSLEDYMRAVYILSKRKRVVRVRDISRLLGVRPSSVTSALKKLSRMNLVEYKKHEYVVLTERGRAIADKLSDRYRSIERFLEKVLSLPKEIAEVDACNIEHHLHDETVNRIRMFVKFVEECPSGVELVREFAKYYDERANSAVEA